MKLIKNMPSLNTFLLPCFVIYRLTYLFISTFIAKNKHAQKSEDLLVYF